MLAAPALLAPSHLDLLRQLSPLRLDLEHLRTPPVIMAMVAIIEIRLHSDDIAVAFAVRPLFNRMHLALSLELTLLWVMLLALPLRRNLRTVVLLHLLLVLHASHVVELQLSLLEAALSFMLTKIPPFLLVAGEPARLGCWGERPFVRMTIAVFDEVEAFASGFIPVSGTALLDVDFADKPGDGDAHCGRSESRAVW